MIGPMQETKPGIYFDFPGIGVMVGCCAQMPKPLALRAIARDPSPHAANDTLPARAPRIDRPSRDTMPDIIVLLRQMSPAIRKNGGRG